MRQLVGGHEAAAFDNPAGTLVYPHLSVELYESVLDFGCGCGRVARQLIQQIPRPRRYLGLDLHAGMVNWCQTNLQPHAPGFDFRHLDVFHASFNPGQDKPMIVPLPAEDECFTLVEACSVFTHLVQSQADFYLHEAARVLHPSGIVHSTWFLFDKTEYPMLNDSQNALYTNEHDLSSAVIFDKNWLRAKAAEAGLTIVSIIPPEIRNFHWWVLMSADPQAKEVEFPADGAPIGYEPAPSVPEGASRIGLD
jgi:ubiquinone/menaquinone biosynthesis C-methylase UbiE